MNIDRVKEILWLPSLRCNLNCKHCGEDQNVSQSDEVDCSLVLKKINESILVDEMALITITGGEPFLNKTFPTAILEGLKRTKHSFHVTSNGYCFDEITHLIDQVSDQEKYRLMFSISIDGLKQTHNTIRRNQNSFDLALDTAKYLYERGFLLSTNTVIQEDNLDELDEIRLFFHDLFPKAVCSMGPLGIDLAENRNYEYTKEYQKKSWRYLGSMLDKKAVLAKGHCRIGKGYCHAGMTNIEIGPDGKVYPCLTGAFYRGQETRKKFCLGDLKTASLDEILTDEEQRRRVNNEVLMCEGCSDPFEMAREDREFGLGAGMSEQEILFAMELEKSDRKKHSLMLGDALLNTSGWYEIEKDGDRRWCWTRKMFAKLFVPVTKEYKHCILAYSKIVREQKVEVYVNGKQEYTELKSEETNFEIMVSLDVEDPFVTIGFLVDELRRPEEVFDKNLDIRQLGVCVTKVTLVE